MELSRRTLLLGAATWGAVGVHAWSRSVGPRHRGDWRLVTWNLRNYGGHAEARSRHAPGHDLDRLARTLSGLDADVLCLQEVKAPDALARVLPGYRWDASTSGGAHTQHLVIARRDSIQARAARTHPCTQIEPGCRPALTQAVELGGRWVTIVVVHLKAGPRGHGLRRRQRDALVPWLSSLPAPRVLVGDFNTTGPVAGDPETEITSLHRQLARAGLRSARLVRNCTAYWEGGRHDRFKEPSILDHVFLDGAARDAPAVQAAPGSHCRRHACEPFISTAAYPDLDYERVSDHCPIVVDVSS
ncbi:MAG: endonuclease/exonuclease/phosphatase family protein [Myxococcota bacterium]